MNDLKPGDFSVRPILHAGEGPIDLRPGKSIDVLFARSAESAIAEVIDDYIRDDVGSMPTFGGGSDALTYFMCVEDHAGKRTCYRVKATLKVKTTVEVIPEPGGAA